MRLHALIPAAGTGTRAALNCPKQYQLLAGRSVIDWVLTTFVDNPRIDSVSVLVSPGDLHFASASSFAGDARVSVIACGGETRRDTVLAGLDRVSADNDDWILVHDAARPGLTPPLLDRLIDACLIDEVGGLLALPVADTIKAANGDRIERTVARDRLFGAQTPQMFRHHLLAQALERSAVVTDEASAVEALGLRPRLVRGAIRNFKLTWPEDFELMEAILAKGQA
ncbi:2-C-methyl-D-erythritol 4-phosphate cytidylyltransferase [soil metagenome]